ncbi:MAG: extracellular solute-binding protein [Clostridiales bacterium]|nr:extracellular solute-binding protein [Clostridiales bacterium]
MKKYWKVLIAMLVSIAILSTLFAGCNKADKQTSQKSDNGKKITLKILKSKAAHEVPHEQMDVFKKLEEDTNIHVQWDNPPDENFNERYNLVMASGELPDVIIGMPSGDVLKYAQMGVIIPLSDQIDKNAPNLKSWMEKRPEIKKAITFTDEKVYYFPMFDETPAGNNPLVVREDWLKKFNMKSPVTTEDWYNYWKAVKEKDPNENGKADEIPFSGNGIGVARSLVTGWDVLDGFYSEPDDGEKIHYGPIENKYKEAITWIAKLYKEGLIDKEIATNDEKAFQGKVGQNLVGSFRGALGGTIMAFNATMPKQIPGFKVMGTAPIKGPNGHQVHASLDQSPRTVIGAVITKADKNVDETVKWIDYFYSREGSVLINMGIEGKDYTNKNGTLTFTDYVLKNPDGLSPKQACGTFSIGQSIGPYVLIKEQPEALDDAAVKETKKKFIIPYMDISKKYVLPNLSFEAADDETRRAVMADVQTYVDETIIKFILGQEPIGNWDKYVEKVKGMKIDNVIKIYQKAFDSYNSR